MEGLGPAPDFVDPVVGWRTWLLVRAGSHYRLRSLFFPPLWVPGRSLVSQCFRRPSRFTARQLQPGVAQPGHELACHCGIYATREPDRASRYVGESAAGRIFGLVALWGRVVEHEHGWRASHAYPSHLLVPEFGLGSGTELSVVVRSLRDYGTPVETLPCRTTGELVHALAKRGSLGAAA